jgi:probable O-glycosylation ligase (exosortase A-associated)
MKGLLFTYGLSYGGAVLSLFNPFIGLLIYIAFAILRPQKMWFWSVPEGNYSRVVAIALLAGWLAKGCGCWQFGRARGVVLAFVGYWSLTTISASWAIDSASALKAVEILTKIVLPFLVGITTIDSVKQVKQLAWVIMLSQTYVAYEANLSYFGGYNRLWEEGFGDMDNNCNAIAFVTCTGLAFFLGLDSNHPLHKTVAFASAMLLVHGIMISFSRGGMLALVITGVVSFLLIPKRPRHYLMFAVAALVIFRLAGAEVLDRFWTVFAKEGARDDSAESRLVLWQLCWDLMAKNPMGIGVDQFGFVVAEYGFPAGKLAHSLWLQVGAEVGFLGLGCLILFYGLCVNRLLPIARERTTTPDPWLPVGARMVIAALIGFAVSAQFVSLKNLEVPYYVTLIGATVLRICSRPIDSSDPPVESGQG